MKNALESVPGVRNVQVNFQQKTAAVEMEPCDTDALLAAMPKAGARYRATVLTRD